MGTDTKKTGTRPVFLGATGAPVLQGADAGVEVTLVARGLVGVDDAAASHAVEVESDRVQ